MVIHQWQNLYYIFGRHKLTFVWLFWNYRFGFWELFWLIRIIFLWQTDWLWLLKEQKNSWFAFAKSILLMDSYLEVTNYFAYLKSEKKLGFWKFFGSSKKSFYDKLKWLWLLKLQKMNSWLHIWKTQITHIALSYFSESMGLGKFFGY